MPPVAITTRELASRSGPALVCANTPASLPSAMIRRRAWTPSSTVIDGVCRTVAISARMISRPVPSPPACTMRRRPCAASRPSLNRPSAERSKATPQRARSSTAPGAAAVMRSTIEASHNPAPAAMVSAACRAGSSSAPTAAAMPPCAQALAAPKASGALASTMTGSGTRCRAVSSPASPAPTMMGWPASALAICSMAWSRSGFSDRQHALDGTPCAGGHLWLDRHLWTHGLQRAADLSKCDPLHVRAKIARPHELDLRVWHRDVIAHRALGHQHDPPRLLVGDVIAHRRSRAGEVGLGHDLRRALRMRQNHQARMLFAQLADLSSGEALMHLTVSGPSDNLDPGFGGHVLRQILVGQHDHALHT